MQFSIDGFQNMEMRVSIKFTFDTCIHVAVKTWLKIKYNLILPYFKQKHSHKKNPFKYRSINFRFIIMSKN